MKLDYFRLHDFCAGEIAEAVPCSLYLLEEKRLVFGMEETYCRELFTSREDCIAAAESKRKSGKFFDMHKLPSIAFKIAKFEICKPKNLFVIISENSKKPFSDFSFPYDKCFHNVLMELLRTHDIFPHVYVCFACCSKNDLEMFKNGDRFPTWASSAFWGSQYFLEWNMIERFEKDGSSVYRIVQKFNKMLRERRGDV